MSYFRIKRGSTAPSFQVDLVRADGKTPVADLTGHTVDFQMRMRGTVAPVIEAASAVVVTPATATVRWDPTAGETAVPGVYEAEWKVTRPDGSTFRVPAEGYDTVEIWDDVEG